MSEQFHNSKFHAVPHTSVRRLGIKFTSLDLFYGTFLEYELQSIFE